MKENQNQLPLKPADRSRVLIADDEHAIHTVLSKILRYGLDGIWLDFAVNGREALESFRTVHQGVIIMDLAMPVLDGRQAFLEIMNLCREMNWETPSVIFLSGKELPPSIATIINENPDHCYLPKPVDDAALIAALRKRALFEK